MGIKLTYNFYHADGNGRDSFIAHASAHQNESFNYVPKAPEMAGNSQPGMSAGLPGHHSEIVREPANAQVVGYTGHFPGDRYAIGSTFQHSSQELMDTFRAHQAAGGPPPLPIAFPDCYPRPVNKPTSEEYHQSLAKQTQRTTVPSFRIPGYGGHPTGHQHVSGFTYGAIAAADGTPNTQGAVIGEGAPGLGRPQTISVVHPNLQPGAAPITNDRFTKAGYTGHVPGRQFSSNFGKQFSMAAKEMLLTKGQPGAADSPYSGGVSDPNNPYNADVTSKLNYPEGNVGRPAKCVAYVAGYAGFRPQATPFDTIPGGNMLPFYHSQRA